MEELIELLPDFYANSAETAALQAAFQVWTAALWLSHEDIKLQLDVATATWGLKYWEASLGLATDVTKTYDYRRTRIYSRLRGVGTSTVTMLQNVAESFSNGSVDIIEYPAEYRFEVKFVGTLGIPPNMDDLTAAIEEIKPAHLAYSYLYTYMTWEMFEGYNHTWDEWDAKGLTWDQFETYKE